jgi:hypothetical protein
MEIERLLPRSKHPGNGSYHEVDERKLNIFFLQKLKESRSVYVPESPTQAEFCASRKGLYTWSNTFVCMVHGGPVEIQTATHLNRNDERMTAPQPVLSRSKSSANFVSLRFESQTVTLVRFWKMSLFYFSIYLKVA